MHAVRRARGARAPDDASRRQPLLVPLARRCAGGRRPDERRHHLVRRRRDRSPRAEQDIAAARDAAEAASRAKSAFLANTSHEIRTPLNGLLGLARLAMRDGVTEGQRQTYVAHILRERRRPVGDAVGHPRLVEDRSRQTEHRPTRRFGCVMRWSRCATPTLPVAQAKGLTLELSVDPALPVAVVGDANRLRQIVGNFVSNAIKFTERGERAHRCHVAGRLRWCGWRCSTAASASTPMRSAACSSRSRRPTSRPRGATAAPAWACRSAASWRA